VAATNEVRAVSGKPGLPDVGILSAHLLFAFQREVYSALGRRGHTGLRPRHGAVFAYLDAAGTRPSELADRSGSHKQVIGTLVDELETLGYVTRQPDPSDRRAKLVVPTARGLDQMSDSREIRAAMEQRYIAAVGEERYELFKQVFSEVVANAELGPE
jgi:DNA-binding MarR family transcriptional regulator